jgi:hypothetical protein
MTSVSTGRSTKKLSWFLCVFSVGAALGYRKQNSYIFTSSHEGMCFNIHAYTCVCVLNHILSTSTCHSTLYKFYTIQITSLFPCLITHHTEKNLFSDTIWNYVNKGQTGWVNIIIRRRRRWNLEWNGKFCTAYWLYTVKSDRSSLYILQLNLHSSDNCMLHWQNFS